MGGGRAVGLLFGGALPWEANNLSFTAMAASESWQITPALADIQAVMREVGPRRTVLAIYFRNPYVLDDASGLKEAGAIVAGFGVSDTALLDVLSGRFKPIGKLPFALAKTLQAVIDNQPDVPGYPAADTLYPFGYGLGRASAVRASRGGPADFLRYLPARVRGASRLVGAAGERRAGPAAQGVQRQLHAVDAFEHVLQLVGDDLDALAAGRTRTRATTRPLPSTPMRDSASHTVSSAEAPCSSTTAWAPASRRHCWRNVTERDQSCSTSGRRWACASRRQGSTGGISPRDHEAPRRAKDGSTASV